MKKKFAVLFAIALALCAGASLASVYTNALGQVVTVSGSQGAYATVSAGTAVPTYVTFRSGINVFVDSNAAPSITAAAYTNTSSIGDMLIGTVSNKVWVRTGLNTFTPVN